MIDINKMTDGQFVKFIKPIWDFLVVSQVPEKADVIFVFGHIYSNTPKYAAKLYKKGLAPVVLATGYINPMSGSQRSEAETYAEIMKKAGVDDKAIIIETKASNTGENVRFGMAKLLENGIIPKTVILVGLSFGMRRFKATFKKKYPEVVTIACPPTLKVIEYNHNNNQKYALSLVAELGRLSKYYDLGYIEKVTIPEEIQKLAEIIKSNQ